MGKHAKIVLRYRPLPLIADEACVYEKRCGKMRQSFSWYQLVKLTKCSGITPAKRMITKARDLHLKVMIGCMNESSIGTAAIAQLAPLLSIM